MANELQNPYSIASGDTSMVITKQPTGDLVASLQVVLDGTFDGTTATARFKQSNDLDLPLSDWNYLPEDALTLLVGSNLLQTLSFTCRYLAVEILQEDATAGTVTFFMNFKES